MGAAGFWMRPPIWAIGHTSINMSPGSDGLKLGYPAPVVRRAGIKWCYVCVPQRPHTTVIQFEGLLAGGPRKSNLCPQQSRKMSMAKPEKQQFMSTAIQKNAHGEVRGIAIYVHSNPEKCPWRGPKNSNLYNNPEKIIHGVDPDDERSKQQIAMCGDDVPDKLKNKAKAATETSPKKFQYSFKKKGMRWVGCEQI